jgi:hypothetical protein
LGDGRIAKDLEGSNRNLIQELFSNFLEEIRKIMETLLFVPFHFFGGLLNEAFYVGIM